MGGRGEDREDREMEDKRRGKEGKTLGGVMLLLDIVVGLKHCEVKILEAWVLESGVVKF